MAAKGIQCRYYPVWIIYCNFITIMSFVSVGQKEFSLEDLRHIIEALVEVKHKWFQIGIQLGLSPSTLECIEGQCSNSFDKALYEMIKEWLKLSDQPHTWNDIVHALRLKSVDEGTLAGKIEKEWISSMAGMCLRILP